MRIQAALLFGPHQPFAVDNVELAGPRGGEVLVKIAASGVCHSDYHLISGATKHPMPVVAGHEGAGVVVDCGPGVSGFARGDHVVLNWAPDCGNCFYCLRNRPNLCETFVGPVWAGTMLDGTPRLRWRNQDVFHFCSLATFAEYAVVPLQSCVKVRKDVPLDVAALVGCAVSTGVGAVLYTADVKAGESVCVLGCGGVGLSVIQGAKLVGADPIIAIDKNAAKLELAAQFGATHAIAAGGDLLKDVRAITGGRGADYAFECVGVPLLQEIALGAVRPGGTLVLAGLSPMGSGTNLPGAVIVRQEKVVKGSYYGTTSARRDFPMLLDLYAAGRLDLGKLISKRYSLHQINEAYEAMLAGSTARGVITF